MIKQLAYWIVFRDLQKNSMFNGIYDARNGDPHFMYGISTVMEQIAYKVGEKVGDEFALEFTDNMIFSEMKAKTSYHFSKDHLDPPGPIKISTADGGVSDATDDAGGDEDTLQ